MVAGSVFASIACAAEQTASRQKIIDLFKQAQSAEQTHEYEKAVSFYQTILKLDSNIAEVWSNMGVDLYRLQRNTEAIKAFEKATALNPTLLAPYIFEGKAHLELGNAEQALKPLKRAYATAPGELETSLALSDAYAKLHQFASSIRVLRKAEKQAPDSEEVGGRLAVTYIEWAESENIEIKKSNGMYRQLLSNEEFAVEHPELAPGEFQKTIESSPDFLEARLALVRFLLSNKPTEQDLQQASQQLKVAREQAPKNLAVMGAGVRLSIAKGDYSQATAELNSLAALDPAFTLENLDTLIAGLPPDVAQEVSAHVRSAGQAPPALDSYSWQLSALDRIRSRRNLTARESAEYASAAWHLGRVEEAMSELLTRPTLTDEERYWQLGTCVELGKRELERTVNAHPDSLRSHLLLANLALQQNNLDAARTEYTSALKLAPDNPDVLLLYVLFLEAARDPGQAFQEAKQGAARFPSSAGLNFEAGELLLLSQQDPADAAYFLERSVLADSSSIKHHVELAKAYAALARFDDAIREMNIAADKDTDGTMHYQLAQWYRRTEQPKEAAKALAECEHIKRMKLQREQNLVSKSVQQNPK
ncbi:MAG: tetratricopeptide repeat protein [Terracidiphilus sp.]|nr:tetratricopeptide repeat protein [Terracidiphilus sp.]